MSLRVLLETSCLRDSRREAGIGRYARQLRDALSHADGLEIESVGEQAPGMGESRPGRFLAAQLPSLRVAHEFRPHLIHGMGGEPTLGFPYSRQVVTVHDAELWRQPVPPGARGAALTAYRASLRALLARCAAFIAPSETSAGQIATALDLDLDRVHVVPHGVSPTFTAREAPYDEIVLAGAGLRRDAYVLWTGNLRVHDPRKATDVLLDAMHELGPGAPPLALVGRTGSESERLASLAKARGIRIQICGPRSDTDLAALYRNALCAVISSRHEGFGLPALEAMASGCALVSTRGGNLGDLIAGVGILVDVDDSHGIAQAIDHLREQPLQRARMRQAGTARAEGYTWARSARKTLAVYLTVLRERR